MAKVYDYVQGVPGGTVSHILPNGSSKQSRANQLERVIALHEDVQRKLVSEGMKIFQRAQFRMTAVQQRHVFRLREEMREAVQSGDPDRIEWAQSRINYYNANKTQVNWAQADVDFHVMLYRPDGKEFYVEAGNSDGGDAGDGVEGRGLQILRKSL